MPGTSSEILISPPTLALFIAYLFYHHYAPSFVNTYLSAIGYSHKFSGVQDPTKTFFITQMPKEYGKIGIHLDSRLSITLPNPHTILLAAAQLVDSFYNTCRFQAMCLFAFHTFSMVGEITAWGNNIHVHQVSQLVNDKQEGQAIKITFLSYNIITTKAPFPYLSPIKYGTCLTYKPEATLLALFF